MSKHPHVQEEYRKKHQRDSLRKVPILKPEQIQKLNNLKKYVNNPQNSHANKARQSIRPSWDNMRPSKSLKSANKDKSPYNNKQKKIADKEHEYDESSGITKQIKVKKQQRASHIKRRTHRAIQQKQESGLIDKCCGLFSRQQRTIQSPFKAARQGSHRR